MAANPSVDTGIGGVCSGAVTVRESVARTQKGYGTTVAASSVVSETKNLRIAYPDVECNIPAIA